MSEIVVDCDVKETEYSYISNVSFIFISYFVLLFFSKNGLLHV